jgi:hypothetical protein
MKIELKHLAVYLPYKLRLVARNVVSETPKRIYSNLTAMNIMSLVEGDTLYKPILRPLSDLTKEIEVNGEKFVSLDKLAELEEVVCLQYTTEFFDTSMNYLPYWIVQKLLEWHFDIYGLIENGLVIDINTLNK